MYKLVILGSVVMLAASSVNCANSPERSSANILAPSVSDAATNARGGNKPGTGTGAGGGSLAIKMVIDKNQDGIANFNDTVTFVVQTTATPYPWVTLKCYQNSNLVSQESNGIFAGSLGWDFTLGPAPLWTSGAADCTATLENWDSYYKNGSITALASMSFKVAP